MSLLLIARIASTVGMVSTAAVMKMARFPNRWLTPAMRSAQATLPAELKDWFFPNWRSKKVTPTIPIVTAASVGPRNGPAPPIRT